MFKHNRLITFLLVSTLAIPILAQEQVLEMTQPKIQTSQTIAEQPEEIKKEEEKTLWQKTKKYLNLKTFFASLTVAALVATYALTRKKQLPPSLPPELQLKIFLANAKTIPEVTKEMQRFTVTFKDAEQFFATDKGQPIIKSKVKEIVRKLEKKCNYIEFMPCHFPEIDQYPYYDLNPMIDDKRFLEHLIEKYSTDTDIYLFTNNLINEGADVNATDNLGNNSFVYALRNWHQTKDQSLTVSLDRSGKTVINYPIAHELIELLLKNKVNIPWNRHVEQGTPLKKTWSFLKEFNDSLDQYGYIEKGPNGPIFHEVPIAKK